MKRLLLFVILMSIVVNSNLNAQDWDQLNKRERTLYLLGWHGIIEVSVLRIIEYMLSGSGKPTGYCSSSFISTFSDTYDSLDTYHFRTADIDSLIYLTDKILLFNKNRQKILQEAINYFRRGRDKYGYIIEFKPIFDGINISEGLVKSDIVSKKLSLDDAVEVIIKKWGNRYEYEEGLGSIVLWSELDSTEKSIYIDGWFQGSMFTNGEAFNIAQYFALNNTKFQRAMKELSIELNNRSLSRYEEDCRVYILEGVLEVSSILDSLRPDISRFFKEKYTLLHYLDENIINSQENEQPISDRKTILSIAEGIKIWNSKSKD